MLSLWRCVRPVPIPLKPTAIFVAYVGLALILRASSLQNPAANLLDEFYILVGQRLHEGVPLYTGIWDRKPPGGFLLFYMFAIVSTGPLFYKLVACIFVAATAFVIREMGTEQASERGGTIAGALYIPLLSSVYGSDAELAVFYNLFVALGALFVIRRKYHFAMLMLGVALTFKQTVGFEAIALGLFASVKTGWRAAWRLAFIGATPMLLVSLPYIGHFSEYWQALVGSNFARASPDIATTFGRGLDISRRLVPLAVAASLGLIWSSQRHFMVVWSGAALLGVGAGSALLPHYAIPLVLPLCTLAAPALGQRFGTILAITIAGWSLLWFRPFDFAGQSRATRQFEEVVSIIERLPGNDMFVFDGPTALYTATGRRTLSPLVFPTHFNHQTEADVSHLNTQRELERVLGNRPSVVAVSNLPRSQPINRQSYTRLFSYLKSCDLMGQYPISEMGQFELRIYSCS